MTDRYEILKLIAKDPAGGVYLAEDTRLERKVMFRHIEAKAGGERSKAWAKEFTTRSGMLCALQHPNLITIYDISIEEDGVSMVAEFIEGESLAERLETGALRQVGVYRMAADVLEALHAAHESGVFHGALHTGSVKRLPRATGGHRYLIVDLGLNTLATMVKGEDVHIADPVLLAPELHDENAEPDAKADLFMLGQLCYTALVGGHPFAEFSPEDCAKAHLAGDLPPLSDFAPHVEKDFCDWVMGLTSGDRDQRPASLKEAMKSLHAIVIDEPLPNVPGETHAVLETLTQATAAQASVSVNTESVANYLAAEEKSSKKTAIVIASLCVLIGLALWLLNRSPDGGGESSQGTEASATPDVPVYLHETEIVNTLADRHSPVTVDFDTENTLDWTVAKGFPVSEKRVEKKGGSYILSLFSVGDFKEVSMGDIPVRITANGEKMIPVAITDSGEEVKAEKGEGWKINMRIPNKHRGPIMVTLYMFQAGCDFDIEVTASKEDEPFRFDVESSDPGVVRIPIEITNPQGGNFYTIKITATPTSSQDGFTMGLSGVHVESR